MLIDWGTGVYMHKESGGMLIGRSDPDEPAGFNQKVDWDFLGGVAEQTMSPRRPIKFQRRFVIIQRLGKTLHGAGCPVSLEIPPAHMRAVLVLAMRFRRIHHEPLLTVHLAAPSGPAPGAR